MKTIKINLSKDIKRLEIVGLADLHIGDPYCNEVELKNTINMIRDNPDMYCIINGDILNAALKNSVSDVYSETLSPMEQLLKARDLLEPIKDKILCVTCGNHDFRFYKSDGLDVCAILAKELGLSDRYSTDSAVIFLKFGSKDKQHGRTEQQMQYTIYVCHGNSAGGRKVGGKLNRLEEVTSIVDADVFVHSHVHLPAVFKQNFFRTNLTWSSVEEVEKLFVCTNAFLNYGGYGATAEFRPASRSVPKIILNGTKREMTATL